MTTKKAQSPKKRGRPVKVREAGENMVRVSFSVTEAQNVELYGAALRAGRRVPDHIRFILFPPEVA